MFVNFSRMIVCDMKGKEISVRAEKVIAGCYIVLKKMGGFLKF